MAFDWQAIRTEYITTDTSYRKLSRKYGVSVTQINTVGRDEKWVEQKQQHLNNTFTKAVNAISESQADQIAKLFGVSGLLLDKVKLLLEENPELLADTSAMKDVSVVLKNLKDLLMVRSDADMREQEARIEKLRKDCAVEKENNEIKVTIVGDLDEYSK